MLGAASKWRALVVPPAPADAPRSHGAAKPPTHRSIWRPWAELMKRSFAIDVEKCPRCGGRMKLRALITETSSIKRFLRSLGEPTEAPRPSPARDPPFYKSRVLRRRSPQSPTQMQMFGA